MKILHCAETVKGGVGTVIDKLMDAQINDSNVSSVFCLVPDSHRYQLSSIDDRFVYTFTRTGRNLKSFLSFIANLLLLLRKYRPDVIHIHSTFSGVMARIILLFLKPFYRPVIIYCPHAFSFLMTSTKIKSKIYSIVEKLFSIATDCIICV
ncbi:TPA: glycosyltransferase, partial [Klebsiella pneumoniae]|nr:glycosyltransferase [Klebsiella pneumoniae]